jgi:hypothetical protein
VINVSESGSVYHPSRINHFITGKLTWEG